jgi:hypothetical protein
MNRRVSLGNIGQVHAGELEIRRQIPYMGRTMTALMPIPGHIDPVPVPRPAFVDEESRVELIGLTRDSIRDALVEAGLAHVQAHVPRILRQAEHVQGAVEEAALLIRHRQQRRALLALPVLLDARRGMGVAEHLAVGDFELPEVVHVCETLGARELVPAPLAVALRPAIVVGLQLACRDEIDAGLAQPLAQVVARHAAQVHLRDHPHAVAAV